MIRPATPHDISEGVSLALEALRTERYPTLVVAKDRIEAMIRECVTSAQHFAWVCQDDETGELVGALGAMVQPGMWFERFECQVLMFYAKRPGEGVKLIREFLKWAHGRRAIKRITFSLEFDADPRIEQLLKRMGFEATCPVLMQVR